MASFKNGIYAPKNPKTGEVDNLYFNIDISNPLIKGAPNVDPTITGTENLPIVAQYTENLTQSIVSNPSEWYATIARFSIPGSGIPIFVFQIINGQSNPNLSPYIITLSYMGTNFQENIIYQAENTYPAPATANPFQIITPYYHVYSYQNMINMINTAFANALAALLVAFPAAPYTVAPYVFFNPVTQLISLVVPYSWFSGIPTAPQIYMNSLMTLTFLNSIPAAFIGNLQPFGKDYLINIDAYPGNTNGYAQPGAAITNPPAFLIFTQEYNTIQYWNSFKNIVFTSGTLPIQAEFIPQNNTVQNFSNNGTGTVAFSPILTDFEPLLMAAGDSRSQLQYFPEGPYRLISLIGSSPLTKIDIQIYWQDVNDNLYPLYIQTNQTASIKILFIRK